MKQAIRKAIDCVPCPSCGIYQDNMVEEMRSKWMGPFLFLGVIASFILFLISCYWALHLDIKALYFVGYAFGVVLVTALVCVAIRYICQPNLLYRMGYGMWRAKRSRGMRRDQRSARCATKDLYDTLHEIGSCESFDLDADILAQLVAFKIVEMGKGQQLSLTPYGEQCYAITMSGTGSVSEFHLPTECSNGTTMRLPGEQSSQTLHQKELAITPSDTISGLCGARHTVEQLVKMDELQRTVRKTKYMDIILHEAASKVLIATKHARPNDPNEIADQLIEAYFGVPASSLDAETLAVARKTADLARYRVATS
jgi:hypothetical protein